MPKGGDFKNMLPVKKVFDINDYKDNDKAFAALQGCFKFLYPVLRKEDYGIDVDVFNGEQAYMKNASPVCKIELEIKHNWQGREFNFPDVQFLAKKMKHLKQDVVPFFVLFNDDCSNAGIISFSKIASCEMDIVKCKGIGDDLFYRIPRKQFVWGIHNIERYLIHMAFQAMNNQYRFVM